MYLFQLDYIGDWPSAMPADIDKWDYLRPKDPTFVKDSKGVRLGRTPGLADFITGLNNKMEHYHPTLVRVFFFLEKR
jgi:hypothetical protein